MAEAEPTNKRGSTRALVALLAFVLGFATVPHRVMEREAKGWFDGEASRADALAAGVARWTTDAAQLHPASFGTGSSRFDDEWLFATFFMAAMGFGQTALTREDASMRDEDLARMERCLDAMLHDPRVHAFDTRAWPEEALTSTRGHVVYLGYTGLALALHRQLRPSSRFISDEEATLALLASRIEASPTGFVETYPGEVYPVDNSSALAALAVHARVSKGPPSQALRRGIDALRRSGIDPTTGLVYQAVSPADATPRDGPRGSGTALATYFLGYADEPTSRALFRALERSQFRTVLGFGGIMEFPRDSRQRAGDVDSGPVFLGFGVSASGFAIGASRVNGDRDMFTALYATAQLFGAPLDENGARTYATGGPLGDAIMFAMLTAPPFGVR